MNTVRESHFRLMKKVYVILSPLQRLSASLPGVDETSIASNGSNVTSSATPTPDSDHLRRVVARQRARDLAEHAKAMLAKDREIEDLRRKCQDLADELSNGDISAPQNAAQFEEKEELVNIIKQAAKERLQLEQQLGHTRGARDKVSVGQNWGSTFTV